MKLPRVGALLSIALVLFPLTAHANSRPTFRNFLNYCTTGAFVSCASVRVGVFHLTGGGVGLIVQLQNLQGTNPHDNVPGSLLDGFDIFFDNIPPDNDSVTDDDYGPGWSWQTLTNGINVSGGANTDFWIANNGAHLNMVQTLDGVAGCTPPDPNAVIQSFDDVPMGWFQTCPTAGAPGSLTVIFNSSLFRGWTIQHMHISWFFDTAGKPGSGCTPGVNCFSTTVTPEPQTIALLATGLLGLSGVGIRARRRQTPKSQSLGRE